ncbi:MAG: hypothetical protein RLZ04_2516 [Actinomycetota bacterium]|jgi:hypothetical protein
MTTRTHSGRIPSAAVALSLVAALAVGVSACSDGSAGATAVTTVAPAATDEPASTDPASTDPASTDPASTEPAPASSDPTTAVPAPVQIDVVVGVDSGEDRVERVAFGSDVTLNIVNGPEAAEYHVHGIDLEVAADPDQMVTLNFVASVEGPYEVEDHETGAVILVIEVDQ